MAVPRIRGMEKKRSGHYPDLFNLVFSSAFVVHEADARSDMGDVRGIN